MGVDNVEFREGLLEEIPLEDRWADVVISNGVINLCADKRRVFSELSRYCVPAEDYNSAISPTVSRCPIARCVISIFGLLESPAAFRAKAWRAMLADSGFVDIQISQPHDTFGEARGEKKARLFDLWIHVSGT